MDTPSYEETPREIPGELVPAYNTFIKELEIARNDYERDMAEKLRKQTDGLRKEIITILETQNQ